MKALQIPNLKPRFGYTVTGYAGLVGQVRPFTQKFMGEGLPVGEYERSWSSNQSYQSLLTVLVEMYGNPQVDTIVRWEI